MKLLGKKVVLYSVIKNVLPKEWIISYYGPYSDYGYASAIASKMYGWYNTVHPKWMFAPYYACMKDNSSDQNYLYSAYGDLGSYYQGFEDTILSGVSNLAMVKNGTEDILEIHYSASDGNQHSGQMSASGCLQMAIDGYSYVDILHYYYDCSPYTGSNTIAEIVSY